MKLAHERSLRRFAGLYLAARKLPQARELFAFRALRQEDLALVIVQRSGDDQDQPVRHVR